MENPNEKADQARIKIESWKKGPVVLASSSAYRKKELASIGFEQITTFAVPDEVERAVHAKTEVQRDAGQASFDDPYNAQVPEEIAAVKVTYLLQHEAIPDEALVCALDTMPMLFRSNFTPEHTQMSSAWSAVHLNKPKTKEEAKKVLHDTFQKLIDGQNNYEEIFGKEHSLSTEAKKVMERGYLLRLLRVNTGYAVRLPDTTTIHTSSSSVNLLLDEIFKLKNEPEKLDKLIDAVIEAQTVNGIFVSVAGGIDYSNEQVRNLLGIREINFDGEAAEQGIYKGFPAQAFNSYLTKLASL